jgi:hypothetical protein
MLHTNLTTVGNGIDFTPFISTAFPATVGIVVLIVAVGVVFTVFTNKKVFAFAGLLIGIFALVLSPTVMASSETTEWNTETATNLSKHYGLEITASDVANMKASTLTETRTKTNSHPQSFKVADEQFAEVSTMLEYNPTTGKLQIFVGEAEILSPLPSVNQNQ